VYDSPAQRDERISKLERECARLSGELVTCARLLASSSDIIRQLAAQSTAHHKTLTLFDDVLGFVGSQYPDVLKAFKQWQSSRPVDSPCDCALCKAGASVEVVPRDLVEELKQRIARDGVRSAAEWLGAEQLKRGAEGR
jgi:hypothetical protein